MGYVNKARPYKKEYQQQKARGENPARAERQRARRKMDATSVDANKNGVADQREGKDISHKKALSKGGKNKDGVTVQSRKKNRAAGGAMSSPKKRKS
jgi:hypothetical protein|tara:strand:+ start:656 stop:946 length:291 start_codon:yes stop_codon:yes gene_type:complete